MNFQCVAIDDAGLSSKIIRPCRARLQQRHQYDEGSTQAHDVDISSYRKLRGLNFGQFWSGFSDGRFSGRSG
jgi:hypothetical protein